MLEKRWKAVLPQIFTVNGTALGQILVRDATLFRVKQQVIVASDLIPSRDDLEVKKIINRTTLILGLKSNNLDIGFDLSAYLPIGNPIISANEQLRSKIAEQEIERFTYEEEPIVARRTIQVDQTGTPLKTILREDSDYASLGVSVDQIPQDLTFSVNGHLRTDESFQGLASGAAIRVTNQPTLVQAGATPLAGRIGLFVMALSNNNFLGFSNALTPDNGIPLFLNQLLYVPASQNLSLWLIRVNGTGEVRVWEVG